jgi:hypothetical protein
MRFAHTCIRQGLRWSSLQEGLRPVRQEWPTPHTHPMNPAGLSIPSRPTAILSIRITPQQRIALDRLASDLNCGTSALARLALAQGLEQIEREHA